MGRRGPAPEPSAIRAMKGNPSRRPMNASEPMPHISKRTPPAPEWLSDGARRVWKSQARRLWELQLLTELDVLAFGAFCEWMALYIRAMREIAAGADVQTAESGYRQQDPWVSIASNAWGHASKIGAHFGMSPSDRSKLRIEAVEKELTLAEELFRIGEAIKRGE
jgi:P27 family predicted phage terminase small subunit